MSMLKSGKVSIIERSPTAEAANVEADSSLIASEANDNAVMCLCDRNTLDFRVLKASDAIALS